MENHLKYFNVADHLIDCNKSYEQLIQKINNFMIEKKNLGYISDVYINNTLADVQKRYRHKCLPSPPQVQVQVVPAPTRVPILIEPLPQPDITTTSKFCHESYFIRHFSDDKIYQRFIFLLCIVICIVIHGFSISKYIEKKKENKLSDLEKNITDGILGVLIAALMSLIAIIGLMFYCQKIVTIFIECILIFLLIPTAIINLIFIFIINSQTNSGLDSNSDSDSNYN